MPTPAAGQASGLGDDISVALPCVLVRARTGWPETWWGAPCGWEPQVRLSFAAVTRGMWRETGGPDLRKQQLPLPEEEADVQGSQRITDARVFWKLEGPCRVSHIIRVAVWCQGVNTGPCPC